jgi:hypothetical protein
MEMRTKQRCVIEFFHAEKIAPVDIHECLLNVYGEQTLDVNTVKWWVVRFSSGNSDERDRPRSRWPFTGVSVRNEEQASISSSVQIGGLWSGNFVWS